MEQVSASAWALVMAPNSGVDWEPASAKAKVLEMAAASVLAMARVSAPGLVRAKGAGLVMGSEQALEPEWARAMAVE